MFHSIRRICLLSHNETKETSRNQSIPFRTAVSLCFFLFCIGCFEVSNKRTEIPTEGRPSLTTEPTNTLDASGPELPAEAGQTSETPPKDKNVPDPPKEDVLASGDLVKSGCSPSMNSTSSPPSFSPRDPKFQDELPNSAAQCTIEFNLKESALAEIRVKWRRTQSTKGTLRLWHRLNQKIWKDWLPKSLSHSDWQVSPLSFDSIPKSTTWRILRKGKNRLTLSWTNAGIAITSWEVVRVHPTTLPSLTGQSPLEWVPRPPGFSLNALQEGARGDGTVDDSPALQAALDKLARKDGGGILFLPSGVYRLKRSLYIRGNNIVIRGEGVRTRIHLDLTGSNLNWSGGLIARGGGCTGTSYLVNDAKKGTSTLIVKTGHSFKTGDQLELRADDTGPPAPGKKGQKYIRNQLDFLRVTNVQGEKLTIHRKLRLDFPVSRKSRACLFKPIRNVGFENFALKSLNEARVNGILAARAFRPWVRQVHISSIMRFGVHFIQVSEGLIIDSTYKNARDFGGGGHGYGFDHSRSSDCLIARTQSFNVRHGIAVQFGSSGIHVLNNEVEGSKWAAIDIHGEYSHHNRVEGNWLRRSLQGVIVGGGGSSHGNDGPGNYVLKNLIGPEILNGIQVANQTRNTTLEANSIVGGPLFGIWVVSSSHYTRILKNRIDGPYAEGMNLDGNHIEVLQNDFHLDPRQTAQAIKFSETSTHYRIEGNTFKGNSTIEHPGDPNSSVQNNGP